MTLSVLSHLLVTERERPRAARGAGFAIPAMLERDAPFEAADPVMGSGSRGQFLVTPRTRDGVYRYALSTCPVENENDLILQLHATLWSEGERRGWSNRASTVSQALQAMSSRGLQAKTLIIPLSLAETICPEANIQEGKVCVIGELNVLVADFADGEALVATSPPRVGVYTRVGDYLGLQLYNVAQTMMVVRDGLGSGVRSVGG